MVCCSIQGCDREIRARGWCFTHYARWSRHGDPNYSKGTAPGEAQKYLREVVFSYDGDECLTWPFNKYRSGCGQIHVKGGVARVPRLVCEHVHGPAPTSKHEAAHSCGKGHLSCVARRHLSWKTPLANKADELVHGTRNFGERNGQAKLTKAQVDRIISMIGERIPQKEIAAAFGVGQPAVSRIANGLRWAREVF